MTKLEAIQFCKNNPKAAAKIILMVEKLEKRIKELESKLNMNSTNSSKPPLSDNKFKNNNSKKIQLKQKRGTQKGHKGNNLKMVTTPDKTEILLLTHCKYCGNSLESADSIKEEKRQLFDLSKIKMEATEYQAHTKVCPNCYTQTKAVFPKNINATTQYTQTSFKFL